MKTIGIISLVAIFVALGNAVAASLSENDKQFLARYEKVRAALAADDLSAAKAAATALEADGEVLAKSGSLKEARTAFEKLSEMAKQKAAGQAGYYIVNCPMLKKDWVQTSEKIGNPCYGKEMATCGEIRK
jgi:hypothetical protein